MCGRYVIARTPGQLALEFDAEVDETLAGDHVRANWNTAPTQTVPILLERLDDQGALHRELHAARWGLVPSWAKDIAVGSKMFNARSETVQEKPSFRAAIKSRRCAIPADGYYEWLAPAASTGGAKGKGKKQPYFVHPPEEHMIWFAGIYEWWKVPEEQLAGAREGQTRSGKEGESQWLLSCSILTCEAPDSDDENEHLAALGHLHNRLPLGMSSDLVPEWITPDTERTHDVVARAISEAYDVAAQWRMHPVTTDVGSVAVQGPHLVEPLNTLL